MHDLNPVSANSVFATPDRSFQIGRVLRTSFAILLRNIVPFGPAIILFFTLYNIIDFLFAYILTLFNNEVIISDNYSNYLFGFVMLGSSISEIVRAIPYSFLAAALVVGSALHLRGQRASARTCVRRGLANLPKVLGIVLLSTLLISIPRLTLAVADFLGASLTMVAYPLFYFGFLIGVFMLIAKLAIYSPIWLAVPVAIIEKRGVFASLGRSFRLTKGDRWRIVLLLVLFWGLPTVSSKLTNAVVSAARDLSVTFGLGFLNMLLAGLVIALGAVAAAVSYDTIRRSKEGLGADEIAKVFD